MSRPTVSPKMKQPRCGKEIRMIVNITHYTEIVEETWHNVQVELPDLRPATIRKAFNVDVRSRRRFPRADGRIDWYYPIYVDGERCFLDGELQYLRAQEAAA